MATRELTKLGPKVTPLLRLALGKDPSPEAHRRLSQLIDAHPWTMTPAQDRLQHAVCAVELMATPAALAALEQLAAGGAGGIIALEAATALKRSPLASKRKTK